MKSSTDVWFCAYLKIKGVKLARYEVISRGKVRCDYDLTDKEWQEFRMEFSNSICSEFRAAVESTKDLAF